MKIPWSEINFYAISALTLHRYTINMMLLGNYSPEGHIINTYLRIIAKHWRHCLTYKCICYFRVHRSQWLKNVGCRLWDGVRTSEDHQMVYDTCFCPPSLDSPDTPKNVCTLYFSTTDFSWNLQFINTKIYQISIKLLYFLFIGF